MEKNIYITMRIDINKEYNEKRDCIDMNWYKLLNNCNINPILLPNDITIVSHILEHNNISGFIFTGGNDIGYEQTIERDMVEKIIIKYSIKHNKTILGVCRGMQAIGAYFGLTLKQVDGHIGEHIITNNKYDSILVNSFHNFAFLCDDPKLINSFEILYKKDNIIEGFKHKDYNFYGIMYHPERFKFCREEDISFIKKIFKL